MVGLGRGGGGFDSFKYSASFKKSGELAPSHLWLGAGSSVPRVRSGQKSTTDVQRSIKKNDQFGPSKDPGGPFFMNGPLELASPDPFWGPFWGP